MRISLTIFFKKESISTRDLFFIEPKFHISRHYITHDDMTIPWSRNSKKECFTQPIHAYISVFLYRSYHIISCHINSIQFNSIPLKSCFAKTCIHVCFHTFYIRNYEISHICFGSIWETKHEENVQILQYKMSLPRIFRVEEFINNK